MEVIKISLTKGKYTFIDKDDYERISKHKWCYAKNKILKNGKEYGIAVTGIWNKERKNNDMVRLHRFILNCPEDKQIDHKNGNPLDNRKCNLRVVDATLNNFNRKGVKGYHWDKRTKNWKVEIGWYGKNIWIGRFKSEEEARNQYLLNVNQLLGGVNYDKL